MNKTEFTDFVQESFARQGYRKIKITPAFFENKATVSARDSKGRKCNFTVRLVRKHGKDILEIKPSDGLEWIDELEAIDILMGD